MKKFIVMCAAFAIAGCADEAPEPAATEEMAVEEVAAEPAIANTMEVTNEDGETTTLVRYDDGTYTFGDATGTYAERDDGMTCYLGDEEGSEESCWADWVEGEDGTMTSTAEDGQVVTLANSGA
ncbi:hypothetical protein [Aurantiacibacter rhizosphaerae]|uniref:Uncharacterized protein n=1 Tax=Aurantiacibacter rhizosphaerae TaxID=2691582 RepID=A0A844XHW0_9SPHN|nr:hypothetical protein [Aurantiacibacter rhizosphaerae]MWV29410.1 hypothetical protein [Aurantiacibacter rhizosphaerae]